MEEAGHLLVVHSFSVVLETYDFRGTRKKNVFSQAVPVFDLRLNTYFSKFFTNPTANLPISESKFSDRNQ